MHRLELAHSLDADLVREICGLIDEATAIEGHPPVGEHKRAHLRVHAPRWNGVLARDRGDLIGYAHLRWNPRGHHPRVAVEVVVHPRRQEEGIQQELLATTRDVVARTGGGAMWLWVHRVEDARGTLAARMGFDVQRELAFMRRRLHDLERLDPPEGIAIRTFRPGTDDDDFLAVNNAAFVGHPENGGWDLAAFRQRQALDWFDPEGLFMAYDGDRPVGFHWTKWHAHPGDEEPPHDPEGEVYVLAVHPGAQGRGLGRVLLRTGLVHLAEVGCATAALYVDCSSTAAVALYEREGFTHESRDVCYEQVVEPLEAVPDLGRPA